jgi:excisionase family DNA binding protein
VTSREPYLTAAEAIAYLRLGSPSALYRLIREHQLPFCRVGRRYRFDRAEVDAWAHGHRSSIDWARVTRGQLTRVRRAVGT